MKRQKHIKIFIVGILMTLISPFYAQSDYDLAISTAAEQLAGLHNGTLVVRIYMNKNKADLLQKTIQDPATSEEKRKSLSHLLKTHLEDRELYKKNVIKAFRNEYHFSKVVFIHDYDQKKLANGREAGIFLNDQGIVDPSIKMESDYYLLCGRGNNDDSFVIYAPNGDNMPTHFPNKYNRNIFEGLASLFIKDKMANYVRKLDGLLGNRYEMWKEVMK
ncbi:MAG TPA: hypothetical protein PK037_05930 [Saprospiraceae bacterium]|nr:hypothetical protein [Saprospiraceae bacterium]